MRSLGTTGLLYCSVFLVCFNVLAQTGNPETFHIPEPPELTGTPKKVVVASPAEKELFEIVGHLTDAEHARTALPMLNTFLQKNPDYSDAYFLRATAEACILNSHDLASINADVSAAMSHSGANVYNATDYYSLLGKLVMEKGDYSEAMDYLEKAMRRDLGSASRMFNIEGVVPERTSKFCIWNLNDLDKLISKFPRDYRAWLFRGLYYEFFTTFKEDYYQPAYEQFHRAIAVSPNSGLPYYFLAQLHTKASFWTKKAWASDASRDEETRNSVQGYTRAIQEDPKLLPAYEERASAYLNLKEYSLAIKDYDRILAQDPENSTAYSDRGIAELETGDLFRAKLDFGEAIKHKGETDSFLPSLYEYRGDANVKLGLFSEAIADYSKAIERRLANDAYLYSLKQFRALYPEYDHVPDDALVRKLNLLFWPEFKYDDFAKHMLENKGDWQISLINELYEKRGDAYLMAGDYRRGVLDFKRIFKGMPNFADSTDRWRSLGKNRTGDTYLLDVKTAEFSDGGTARLWLKTTTKTTQTIAAYEVNCSAKQLKAASVASYDPEGKLLNASDVGSSWQYIVPDSLGEQLYTGSCSSGQ